MKNEITKVLKASLALGVIILFAVLCYLCIAGIASIFTGVNLYSMYTEVLEYILVVGSVIMVLSLGTRYNKVFKDIYRFAIAIIMLFVVFRAINTYTLYNRGAEIMNDVLAVKDKLAVNEYMLDNTSDLPNRVRVTNYVSTIADLAVYVGEELYLAQSGVVLLNHDVEEPIRKFIGVSDDVDISDDTTMTEWFDSQTGTYVIPAGETLLTFAQLTMCLVFLALVLIMRHVTTWCVRNKIDLIQALACLTVIKPKEK